MSDRPEFTPPCCDAWPKIAPHLRWFHFTDWPEVLAMPCVPETDLRVNFCPSCGAGRRDTYESKEGLRGAAPMPSAPARP